jgi:hypothetical protein
MRVRRPHPAERIALTTADRREADAGRRVGRSVRFQAGRPIHFI